ncbi:uncharacterized protein LOC144942041 [Lampetra fluviatilis]
MGLKPSSDGRARTASGPGIAGVSGHQPHPLHHPHQPHQHHHQPHHHHHHHHHQQPPPPPPPQPPAPPHAGLALGRAVLGPHSPGLARSQGPGQQQLLLHASARSRSGGTGSAPDVRRNASIPIPGRTASLAASGGANGRQGVGASPGAHGHGNAHGHGDTGASGSAQHEDAGGSGRAGRRAGSRGSARRDEGASLSRSLPLHLSPRIFGGFKCPLCSKSFIADEMEAHISLCLAKPRITYNDDVLSKHSGECAICLEELELGDTIARLPCLCVYHKGCIDSWFEINRSCPEHPAD